MGEKGPEGDKPEFELGTLGPWLLLAAVGLGFFMIR